MVWHDDILNFRPPISNLFQFQKSLNPPGGGGGRGEGRGARKVGTFSTFYDTILFRAIPNGICDIGLPQYVNIHRDTNSVNDRTPASGTKIG